MRRRQRSDSRGTAGPLRWPPRRSLPRLLHAGALAGLLLLSLFPHGLLAGGPAAGGNALALNGARFSHTAEVLANGRVLVAGGAAGSRVALA